MRVKCWIPGSLLLLFCQPVLAADVPAFCHPLSPLLKNIKDCSDNRAFVEAADLCLQKIDREVQANQLLLASTMKANSAAAADAQNARITNNGANLTNTQATLAALLASANLARAELAAYVQNLVWPGPLSAKAVRALGAEGYLGQFSCYKESQKALVADLASLDGKIESLRKTAAAGAALQVTTNSFASGMNSGSGVNAVAGGRGPADKKPKLGTSSEKQSQVTGILEDMRKQQLPPLKH